MLIQHLLDLARPDLEPGRDDHVLRAVDEVEPAVLVHEPDVAGLQPGSRQRLRRLLGLLPVAGNDLRPGDDELADLARPRFVAGVGDHFDVRVADGHADRHGARMRIDGRNRAVRRHVRRRCRLGQAVHRLDAHACAAVPILEHARGRRRAARVELRQPLQVVLREHVAVQERDVSRDRRDRERRAMQGREAARLVGVEAIEQHQRAARQHRKRDVADEARDVE